MTELNPRRMLLVHAHPDDETIGTGATMTRYIDEGAQVTLVTCTLGEEGEVLVDELGHLASDQNDDLGPHRLGELTEAMALLGVTDFVRLGGDGRFRDSGMVWDDTGLAIARDELHTNSFWTTDLLTAANELVPLIRDRRPQVLITYDEFGGYGHPDHIQAHRVAMYAYVLAGMSSYRPDLGEAWAIPRVLWQAMSESSLRSAIKAMREAGDLTTWEGIDPDGPMPPMAVPDSAIDAITDGSGEFVGRKLDALRAHATQITEDGPFFGLVATLGDQAWAYEHFRLAAGTPFPETGGWADDLFAGLD